MKKKKLLTVLILFSLILTTGIYVSARSCSDICVPQDGETCTLLYGDDGDMVICGNWKSIRPLPPKPVEL